jgi:hypothetical protein
MTDRLALYNGALLLCGERELASLTENREPRRLLDSAWNSGAVNACLGMGQWKFATRTVEVAPDAGITPGFGYQYAYEKPSDHIRTVGVWADEYGHAPLLAYRQEQRYWFTDAIPVYIGYVSNDAAYGGNLAEWPADFCELVEAKLASRIILRLTQDEGLQKKVFGLMDRYKKDAASGDAMEGPTQFPPAGSWSRARHGGAPRRDRGSRRSLLG